MDRVQKLDYQKSMEEYFHTHKVNELLENLFEELIVNKPKNQNFINLCNQIFHIHIN